MKLLHAADLHLDSPFAALRPEQAAERRTLRRQLPGMMAQLCKTHGCDLWLLAGDVFDTARVCPETVEALWQAFADCGVPVLIAPGNHDPYTEHSPWAKTVWPDNVHIFTGAQTCVELPDCRVWGAAFTASECHDGLRPVPPDSRLQIGVFHGDPENPGSYRYLSRNMLEHCGLDYLALGHIHKTAPLRQAGRTFYGWPGTAMGRGFDETGVCGVYLVELERGACRAQLLPMPGLRYEKRTVTMAQLEAELPCGEDVICRLTLTGEAEPFDRAALEARLRPGFAALELRDETVPTQALWRGWAEQSLRGLALESLKTRYDEADDPETRQTLAMAARYVLAALEGRDGL